MYLFFSKLSLPRPVGDADFSCCHYRDIKMVQEPLQHKLVPKFSLEFFFSFYLGYSSYFHFHSFFQPISCNDFQDACAFYRKMSFYQHFDHQGTIASKSGSWAGKNQSPWRDTEVSNS